MKIRMLKIFYYLILVVYLTSINVYPFFHHHQEGHYNGGLGDILHTHSFDSSQGYDHTSHTEFHSDQNNYFDENHALTSSGFLFTNSIIILSYHIIGIDVQKENTFSKLLIQPGNTFSRDTYVLTESNLPPPIS